VNDGDEVEQGEDPLVWTGYLRINEFVTSNESGLQDEDGNTPDWIEIYNPGADPVNLAGWSLSDDKGEPAKWVFPDIAIAPDSYLVIFASEKDRRPNDGGELHTNFKLEMTGEYLALYNDLGVKQLSSTYSPEYEGQKTDYSYGLSVDTLERRYFDTPTPGSANTAGNAYIDIAKNPDSNIDRGFYDSPFSVALSSDTPGATIYYTLDGSVPTESNGTLYTGSIAINETSVLRSRAFRTGYVPSSAETHTYIFNATDTMKSLPVLSVVGDAQESLYEPNGIMAIVGGHYDGDVWVADGPDDYSNPTGTGREYERPISLELIQSADNSGFQLNCGVRVQGSEFHRLRYRRGADWFGCWNRNKFSMKFLFREEYGKDLLNYPLFPLSDVEDIKAISCRGGFVDSCDPFIRDELIRRLHKDMGGIVSNGSLANLFVNGEFKGFYNPVERLDEGFCRIQYDSDEDWDIITHRNSPPGWTRNGDRVAWDAMLDFARTNDLSVDANYTAIGELLDITNFIDFLLCQIYSQNHDWPLNNWTAMRERSAEGIFRFYIWDTEAGMTESGWTVPMDQTAFNHFPSWAGGGGGGLNGENGPSPWLYRALKVNPNFRQLFGDRVQKFFYNGGALTNANVTARFYELKNEMALSIPSMTDWIADTFVPQRRPIVLNACISEGMFTFEGPQFEIDGLAQHGGHAAEGALLGLVNPQGSGTMYYTLDGTDPRLPDLGGGALSRTTLVEESATKRVLVPTADIGTDWQGGVAFDDSGWTEGTGGVGYDTGANYVPYFDIDVEGEMSGIATTCYIRIPFNVDAVERANYNFMNLRVRYDDGFVAYINGQEVARSSNAVDPLAYDSFSTEGHDDNLAVNFVTFNIANHLDKLVDGGGNILAVHGLNVSAGSSDFLISAELEAGESTTGAAITPGAIEYIATTALTHSVRVMARTLDGGLWSGLTETAFAVGPVAENLRISEIMYHPQDAPAGNPEAEFIELVNMGATTINLNLVEFNKGIDFTFPNMNLVPGEYVVVAKDQAAFESVYGAGVNVAGYYGPDALANSGERVKLRDAVELEILDFNYKDSWYDITDGSGFSLNSVDAAALDLTAWDRKAGWRASSYSLGTPGADDDNAVPAPGSIVINEVLAHSHAEAPDWIELHNTTGLAINIGGWFLSDNNGNLMKYEIPNGTSIPANGFAVFYEDTDFGNISEATAPFALSENGEAVYLTSGNAGMITGYSIEESFGASATGVPFGRYYKASTDTWNFVSMSTETPGAANASPLIGPVVITEIMYHPQDEPAAHPDAEFVELYNITASPVTLEDGLTGVTWKMTSGIDFTFPAATVIPAGGYLLLVKDASVFAAEYPGTPGGVQIFQWTAGSLNNGGERVELSMPGDVDGLDVRQYIRVDRVNYDDALPWPVSPDGTGDGLTRIVFADYGNDVANWAAVLPTPGDLRNVDIL
jgi:hypothetical protein